MKRPWVDLNVYNKVQDFKKAPRYCQYCQTRISKNKAMCLTCTDKKLAEIINNTPKEPKC